MNYIKTYLTFLSRNKAYTLINVFGLSLSLMFVLLIGAYTAQECSVNDCHPKADRIYALGVTLDDSTMHDGLHHAFIKYLKKRYPEVEDGCAIIAHDTKVKEAGDEMVSVKMMMADPSVLTIFDLPMVSGNPRTALNDKCSAVITEQLARQLFGSADPIGKEIELKTGSRLRVTGVMKAIGNSSIPQADMFVNFNVARQFNMSDMDEYFPETVNSVGASVYILARKGADLSGKAGEYERFFGTFFPGFTKEGGDMKLIVTPLKKLYFARMTNWSGASRHGDAQLVMMLAAVGLVILIFSILNYINLTVSQSGYRAREMATRRLLGDTRWGIAMQLMGESMALCLLSLVIAVALAVLAAPYAGQLLDKKIDLGLLLSPLSVVAIVLGIVIVGVLSGIIPAVTMSRAKPIDVVRGTFRFRTKMVSSRAFITLQNVVTIVMLAMALTMTMQMHHLASAPLGFNTHNVMSVPSAGGDSTTNAAFISELKKLPCVKLVSACQGTPADGGNNQTYVYDGKSVPIQFFHGDLNYIKLLGLSINSNDSYDGAECCYVNKRFLSLVKPPINQGSSVQDPFSDNVYPIAGTTNTFHIRNLLEDLKPTVVFIHRTVPKPWGYLISIEGNASDAYKQVQDVYKAVFHEQLDVEHPFLDQQVQEAFEAQQRLAGIVMVFAIIAIVISMLGLVAMSTYFIQQRQKEIAIRKVFGSTGVQVRCRLIGSFLTYAGVAFVIAAPVSWYLAQWWISQYSYRIAFWPYIIVAGVVCMLIAFVAVFTQSYIASNENPVDHIKDNG